MTARIDAAFARCRAEGRAALVTYVMAGDPDPETSLKVLEALPKAGPTSSSSACPSPIPWPTGRRSRRRVCGR